MATAVNKLYQKGSPNNPLKGLNGSADGMSFTIERKTEWISCCQKKFFGSSILAQPEAGFPPPGKRALINHFSAYQQHKNV